MNITSLIKFTTASAAITVSALLSSCVQPVAQQQAGVNQAQTAANPYAVPGLNGQAQAPPVVQNPNYYPQNNTASNTPAPYQPLPGVPSDVPNIATPPPVTNNSATSQPTAATTHDVIRGESLWRISKKYGVSIEAIQQANGISDTNIWAGQKLIIPAGN